MSSRIRKPHPAATICERLTFTLGSPAAVPSRARAIPDPGPHRNHGIVIGKDLKTLFLAYGRELHLYLTTRLRDSDTAADLVQETFLRFAEQRSTEAVLHDRAYLFQTARNLAIDHFRQEQRRRTTPTPQEDLVLIAEDGPGQEETVAARQRLDHLQTLIDELPDLTRRIFVLNRLEGMTHAEVARHLGISESSVQKHLAKALHHAMAGLAAKE